MSQLADESFVRYEKEFDSVQDVFELQVSFPPMAPCHDENESKRSLTALSSHSAT